MSYPQPLLPKTGYKIIDTNLKGNFLLRTTQVEEIWDIDTDELLEEALYSNPTNKDSLQFLDYSTNLLGHYEYDHRKIVFQGNKEGYFYELWKLNTEVDEPILGEDFFIADVRGGFCLPCEDLHGQTATIKRTDKPGEPEMIVTCVVGHKPTNSNFWHYEILAVDEEGSVIPKTPKNAWKKDYVKLSLKHLIINSARKYADIQSSIKPLNPSVYTTVDAGVV